MKSRLFCVLAAALCGSAACDGGDGEDDASVALLGGATTVRVTGGSNAFSLPAANLSPDSLGRFETGDFTFGRSWVNAGSTTVSLDGLGPTFNSQSCSGCHDHDGRGRPPTSPQEPMFSMLVRLSVPGEDDDGGPKPEPVYGGQLNDRAILDVPVEGRAVITYTERPGTYADGTPYSLREPNYELRDLGYGPMAADVMMSPRVAPAMIGLGLLEAVPEATILALADEADRNGDLISGRPNYVKRAGVAKLGRFGWKANKADLEEQTAGAFVGDLGITSPLQPKENCTSAQTACLQSRSGADPGDTEINRDLFDQVVFYSRLLAVPAARNTDTPEFKRGRTLFRQACSSCHVETLHTGPTALIPELANQTIHPFTDLLLHDMGEGLADGRPDHLATGREWRTPPLWGAGLVKSVNKHDTLMHDGRARGFAEAVLWHGGEGERAKETFRTMPAADRAALVRFLESL